MKRLRHIPYFLAFVIFFINYFHAFPQDRAKIDSLSKQIELIDNDSVKIDLYQKLFWEYRRSDLGKALEFATKSFELSTSSHNYQGIAMGQYMMAIINKDQGNYDEASDLLHKAMSEFQKLNDTNKVVSCLTDLGSLYYQQDEYEEALNYLEQAGNLVIQTKDNIKLGRIYNSMGSLFLAQSQFEKALEYYNKSLELNEKENFKLGMSVNYNNLGSVYIELEEFEKAKSYYLKSLSIKQERKDALGIATTFTNLGRVCFMEGKYGEAITYHEQSLAKYTEIGDQSKMAVCLINLADDYLALKNYSRATEFARKAISITKTYSLKSSQTEAYRILSGAYAGIHEFEKAYLYQKLYKSSNDSIQNVDAVKQISEMEAKFKNERKEKEIAVLNAEKEKQDLKIEKQKLQRNLMIGAIALILALLGFLYWGYRNKMNLNKKLQEINLTKSRFFANISHEFRTPLTLLLGPLEKLLSNPDQKDKDLIGLMHRNASRLLVLDNQLLELSKLESGNLKLAVSEGDLTQVVRGMVMSFQSLAEKQQIDLQYKFPDQELMAFYDQDKLEKIVYNLLSNAIKFTPEMGKVIFELSAVSDKSDKLLPAKVRKIPGKVICISVSDTGPGISKEHQQKIFDRFYQVDSRLNRKYEGTGLGLSLSKELTELHHGIMHIESEPSKGSVFKVFLPVNRMAYLKDEIISSVELSNGTLNHEPFDLNRNGQFTEINESGVPGTIERNDDQIRVLIIEDNSDMRTYIRDCFDSGFGIDEAVDGKVGFESAIRIMPDIIISDLMMPEMDGIELCHQLKNDERTSHIPVILLTALASVEDRIRGLETGADDYIAKPFNRQELLIRAQNLINQRKQLIERFVKSVRVEPKEIAVTSTDEKFIEKLISKIEKNLSDPDLTVDALIEEAHLSRSQLHRKLKAISGLSATEFIRTIRLKRAAQLLEQHYGTIAETVYAVGFNNLSYFSKCFHKQFGQTPKEYIEKSKSA